MTERGIWFNEGFRGAIESSPVQQSESTESVRQQESELSKFFVSEQTERATSQPVMYDQFDIIGSERMAGGE